MLDRTDRVSENYLFFGGQKCVERHVAAWAVIMQDHELDLASYFLRVCLNDQDQPANQNRR